MASNNSGRIFLRDSETGEFYKNPDAWVSNPGEATTFETHEEARRRRSSIARAKLELLVLDERGQPRSGFRLWTDGQSDTANPI